MCVGEAALRGLFEKVTMTDTENLETRLGNPRMSIWGWGNSFRNLVLKAKLISLKLNSEQAPCLFRTNSVLVCNVQEFYMQIYNRTNNQITIVLPPGFLQQDTSSCKL